MKPTDKDFAIELDKDKLLISQDEDLVKKEIVAKRNISGGIWLVAALAAWGLLTGLLAIF